MRGVHRVYESLLASPLCSRYPKTPLIMSGLVPNLICSTLPVEPGLHRRCPGRGSVCRSSVPRIAGPRRGCCAGENSSTYLYSVLVSHLLTVLSKPKLGRPLHESRVDRRCRAPCGSDLPPGLPLQRLSVVSVGTPNCHSAEEVGSACLPHLRGCTCAASKE